MRNINQRKKGAVLSYVSIIATTLVQLLYTPFLIKMLGQSEYGLYSLVYSIIGYLTVLDLGFGNAIVVYTSKYREQKRYDDEQKLHGMFFVIFCAIAIIAVLFGVVLYFNVENLFGKTMTNVEIEKAKVMMLILTFNLFITFTFNIYSSIITAYEKFVFQKLMAILNTILKPLIMIPLLFLGFKSIIMCIVVTGVNTLIMVSNYLYCRKRLNIKIKFKGFDKKLFKIIFSYSFYIFLAVIVDKINWSVDQFVLGAVSGTVAVSLYSIASSLNQLFINLSTALSGVLLPKMSKLVAQNATNSVLTNEFIKVGRLQCLIIFLMCSGLVLFGKEFIFLWVGKGFETSYYIAIILILPLSIPLIQNIGISIMQAKNMHKFRSVLCFCTAIMNVIFSIPLAKLYGGIGSALGTAISLVVGNIIIMNIYYHRKVGINILKFWREIIRMTIPFVIPIISIIAFRHFIELSGITSFLVFGSVYTILYCIVAYFFAMNTYEKDLVKTILKKFRLAK